MNSLSLIHEFLALPEFAFVGVSRNPAAFSRLLYRDFRNRDYRVLPVNPYARDIDGTRCYASVSEITPPPTAVLIMASRNASKALVRQCCQAGATLVWVYGISGSKDVAPEVLRIGEEYGARIIPGYCPYMFFRDSPWFHRLHTTAWKLIGLYPK
jgi:predicted CoA-binding protein